MIVDGILYTHNNNNHYCYSNSNIIIIYNNNNNNSNNMQKRKWNENLQVDDSSPDTTTAIHHKPFCCILVCKIQVTQVPSPFDSTEKVLDPEESLWQHSRWFVIVSHESCVCKKHGYVMVRKSDIFNCCEKLRSRELLNSIRKSAGLQTPCWPAGSRPTSGHRTPMMQSRRTLKCLDWSFISVMLQEIRRNPVKTTTEVLRARILSAWTA